jgi:DNA modification methylase
VKIEFAIATNIHIGPGRIREDLGEIQELADSISQRGLLQPIILDEHNNIIAGFRRFLAMRLLKWDKIPYVLRSALPPTERLAIEIEENTKRKQFTWQEEAAGMNKLHTMMVTLKGAPTPGSKSSTGWTVTDTAKMLNKSEGKVSEDLQLARFVDHDVVGQRQSRVEALRAMKRTTELETMAAVASAMVSLGGSAAPGTFKMGRVVNDDCVKELARLAKESIDLILTDPPYGINIDQSRWEAVSVFHTYKDVEQQDLQTLLSLVFRMCHNVLKPGRYLFTFCPTEFSQDWRRMLIDCGFNTMPRPLIWYKQRGSLTDFFTQFGPAYETFLCAWKGDSRRPFSKPLADVFNYARPLERWHKLERAPGVLSDIIETASAPNEVVLDPFCGGGSTLAASARAFRRYHGVEVDRIAWARAVQRLTIIEEGKDDLTDEPAAAGPVATQGDLSGSNRIADQLAEMVRDTSGSRAVVDPNHP